MNLKKCDFYLKINRQIGLNKIYFFIFEKRIQYDQAKRAQGKNCRNRMPAIL